MAWVGTSLLDRYFAPRNMIAHICLTTFSCYRTMSIHKNHINTH